MPNSINPRSLKLKLLRINRSLLAGQPKKLQPTTNKAEKMIEIKLDESNFLRIFFVVCIFIVSAAAMKVYVNAYIQWVVVLLFMLSASISCVLKLGAKEFIQSMAGGLKRDRVYLSIWVIFIVSVLLSAIFNDWQGVTAAAKYFMMLLLMSFFLVCIRKPDLLRVGLIITLFLTVILLVVVLLFYPNFVDRSIGRVGWLWMPAGVLWKVAIYLIPILFWHVLIDKQRNLSLALLFFAMGLLVADGSRTGSIIFFLTITALFVAYSVIYGLRFKSALFAIGVLAIAVILRALVLFLVNLDYYVPGVNVSSDREVEHRTAGDSVRLQMLKDGLDGVVANFPLGGGFGSTATVVDGVDEPIVVHMAYIQVFSDLGLLGILAYFGMLLYPVYLAMKFIVKKSVEEFERILLPLSIVVIYFLSGFLHPISNEISEWFLILVSIAIIINLTRKVSWNG